jgi:hypothetical protein
MGNRLLACDSNLDQQGGKQATTTGTGKPMAGRQIDKHQPTCLMSHSLLNKLSVIIGSCDLIQEEANRLPVVSSESMRRIAVVRGTAMEMVNELKEHLCELDSAAITTLLRLTVDSSSKMGPTRVQQSLK